MSRKTDKRVRLIDAAKYLIHKQGFNCTTLAHIAEEAEVPLGNVYYYFKTKEAIGGAVLDDRAKELQEHLQMWDQQPDHLGRLLALLRYEMDQVETTSRSGCPVGTLCQELAKEGGELADSAAQLLNNTLNWCEKQLQGLIAQEHAREHALQFMAMVQGTSLLTHTFKDTKITTKMNVVIEQWLKQLKTSKSGNTTARVATGVLA